MFGTQVSQALCRRTATPTWPPCTEGLTQPTGNSPALLLLGRVSISECLVRAFSGWPPSDPLSARPGPTLSPRQPAHGLGCGPFSSWCQGSPGVCREQCLETATPETTPWWAPRQSGRGHHYLGQK